MVGYDPDFIGVHIPLPRFRPNLVGDVLRNDRLRDGLYADYPHYTVVMNARLRSPIFAALNINQALVRSVDRSDDWATDSRIGDAFQLDNAYYASNRWDKGHMAARAGAAWGRSDPEALIASDETLYYSNAALQADNLNRDEWRGLETWVRTFDDDVNNRVSVLSGPIYRGDSRFVTPGGLPPARVPSAFFKVVYFRHRDDAPGAFSVRAFIMTQDAETLRTRSGWELENLRRYQVSVRQIETLTGLDFPEQTGRANPIFFSPSDAARDLNVTRFPEVNEVDAPRDIVDPGQVDTSKNLSLLA
jgi:endonuclease G